MTWKSSLNPNKAMTIQEHVQDDLFSINRELFERINFAGRFEALSRQHPIRPDLDRLMILDFDLTKEILESFGYKIRYFRGERFFQATEKRDGYEFRFNIALDYGRAELITSVYCGKKLVREVSDVWMGLYELLMNVPWEQVPRYPFFGDYDELEAVLRESFSLWEDFKREFLAEYPKPM